jgi:hypothetical protein
VAVQNLHMCIEIKSMYKKWLWQRSRSIEGLQEGLRAVCYGRSWRLTACLLCWILWRCNLYMCQGWKMHAWENYANLVDLSVAGIETSGRNCFRLECHICRIHLCCWNPLLLTHLH